MKGNFNVALAHVLREEGGLSDDRRDPGGLTHFGITLPTLTRFLGRDARRADLINLTRQDAAEIYRTCYWDAIHADALPDGIDLFLFDFSVNSGPSRAVKTLQTLCKVRADGVVGPKTRAALNVSDPRVVIEALHKARLNFLQSLSVWPFFGRGWSKRNDRTRAAALALVASPALVSSQERISSMSASFEATKSVLQSRTIWANVIGLASLGLSVLGYGGLDVGGLTDAVLQTVTAASFIASSLFRIKADTRLT